MKSPRVIIIGAGAAGMLAAGRAAQCGSRAVILEKGQKTARKLRITGKGRCNITNTADIKEFVEAFGPNGKFLYGAFSRFFRDELLDILTQEGVQTKIERGGRVFPVSDKAGDVADALERWLLSAGAGVKYALAVKSIEVRDGRVTGVKLFGGRMDAGAVVIATGGMSYPKTGSTGEGYSMAGELGHTVKPLGPALSALVTQEPWVPRMQGLSLKNVEAKLIFEPHGGAPVVLSSEFGEMLFTHFGISGPIILTISRGVGELLKKGNVGVSIDLKPALSSEQLDLRLIRDFKEKKHVGNYLRELLPKMMIDVFVELSGIDPAKPVHSVSAVERAKIVETLKDLRVAVRGMAPLDEAIVTSGGVDIKEIDPRTMMSKLIDGLFFAGEVIDIDGRTGGFNLQAAFSTGWVAGESAAEYVRGLEQ